MAAWRSIFSFLMKFKDWCTISMALFTTIPTRITNPNMVRISRGWFDKNALTSHRPRKPPAAASGTLNMITRG
ncbi:hypothetical protein ES703_83651 [subsurface metagenome]